jgi:crossover junction endodeoxyribonuclease RuvC
MAITGNGNASKEQVAGMLQNLLNLKEFPTKYLDATDGLAVAVCHSFNLGKADKEKSYTGWESFLKQNPDRIK